MKELFQNQIDKAQPISEELLEKFKSKVYFNNDNILIGDIVLFALLEENKEKEELICSHLFKLTLIQINEKHLFEFELDERFKYSKNAIPVIKLK